MGVAKISIGFSFLWYVTQFLRDFQLTFLVVFGCFKTSQTAMGDAKIAIRLSFHWSVIQFFCDF